MSQSPAAVTGATGLIGSAVVRALLSQGRAVRAIVEPGAADDNLRELDVERVTADVRDAGALEKALSGCGSLFHLAAIYRLWMPDPGLLYAVNLEGPLTTLLAARRVGIERIVYTSSIAAVGLREGQQAADELDAFNLHDIATPYVLSKHLAERMVLRLAEDGLPVVVVNPAFPFGIGDRAPTPTGNMILSLLRGEVFATGEGGFCAIDVDDVAAGHLAAEASGRVGERYILGNHNVSLTEFFTRAAAIAGVAAPKLRVPNAVGTFAASLFEAWADRVSHEPPPATPKSLQYLQRYAYFDNAKARRELALPQTPLETTLENAIRFFRDAGMV